MDKHNDSFFSALWKRFIWSEDRDPIEAKPEQLNRLSISRLRQLERCLVKDCEVEINRKKLERQWQQISS